MAAASKELLEGLVRAGKITASQREAVRARVAQEGARPEDVLVEQGILTEETLLEHVSGAHGTRFVSTEKLAKLDIDRAILELLPRSLAERLVAFPVRFNPSNKSLAVVAADPGDRDALDQLRIGAGVSAVKAYAARPAAVRAAIHKHYGGDIHAFAKLDAAGYDAFKSMLDVYERNLLTEEELAQPHLSVQPVEQEFSGEELGSATITSSSRVGESADSGPLTGAGIEICNVLVSLLEHQRAELRGHSAQVSRMLMHVGQHMGLPGQDLHALRLAGLLHDVGKTSNYHLTALNVAEYEGHRVQAMKVYMSPVRLFEAAELPTPCSDGLMHMYERVDGQGFPDRRAGKDIPLASRLLAIAETYADLTANARNPFRKRLSPEAAIEVLGRYKDRIFDANLVDLFRVAALGEELQSKLLNDRPRVVLVDTDAEETTILELRLVEQGCDVVLCRNAQEAYTCFKEGNVDALIVEVDLEPHDGFSLVEHIRKLPAGADVPVLFMTARADRASVDRGFDLGAVDYIIKPAAADVVVAKTRNALAKTVRQRSSRGVSGSLREMQLPDVLQVLSRTRKTGRLKLACAGHVGEIHFRDGDVYNAMFMSHRGEDAVYALLQLTDGDFALDPSFVPDVREIHAATESLLLEGMRRWDEERNDFGATRVE